MKRKFLVAIISVVTALSLVACSEVKQLEDIEETPITNTTVNGESETHSSIEATAQGDEKKGGERTRTDLDDYELIYKPLIDDCYNIVFNKMEPMYSELYALYADTVYYSDEEKASIGYCYEDIDGNGRMELLVGSHDVVNVLATYDDEGRIIILASAGYRSHLSIFETGTVLLEGSSGAASYSYKYSTWENGILKTADFYFTDADNQGGVNYYHNTTGEWDADASEQLDKDVFNVSVECGLEVNKYEDKLISFEVLKDELGGGSVALTMADLKGSTWDFLWMQDKEMFLDKTDSMQQFLEFRTDGTVVYTHNDSVYEYTTEEIEVSEDSYNNVVYLRLVDEQGRNITLRVARKDKNGRLIVQRSYYDYEEYDTLTVNETYIESVG